MGPSQQTPEKNKFISLKRLGDPNQRLNPLQKLLVQHAYPPKTLFDGIGFLWGLHFVWENMWIQALVSVVGFTLFGSFLTRNINKEALGKTIIGRFFLEFAHPGNLATQLLGYTTLVFGVWVHTSFYVLLGISIILFAHATAWRRFFLKLEGKNELN